MPREYRTRSRIIMDILCAVRDEPDIGNTRLLLMANLSNDRLKEYLGELTEKAWVVGVDADGRMTYRITNDGRAVLADLQKVQRLMEDYGLGL